MFTHFRLVAGVLGLTLGLSVCNGQEATGYALPDVVVPAPKKLVQRTHLVADLVVPMRGSKEDGAPQNLPHSLMRLLMCSVAPETWAENAGCGTIEYFPLGMTLVINQTPDVQEQIADLLAGLR